MVEAAAAHSSGVTDGALVLALVACLAAGWYGRRLVQAHRDVTSSRQRLEAAITLAWAARRVAAVAAVILFIIVWRWVHQHGG